jgi:hypothetical protein
MVLADSIRILKLYPKCNRVPELKTTLLTPEAFERTSVLYFFPEFHGV